jgi:hypothetical protein
MTYNRDGNVKRAFLTRTPRVSIGKRLAFCERLGASESLKGTGTGVWLRRGSRQMPGFGRARLRPSRATGEGRSPG